MSQMKEKLMTTAEVQRCPNPKYFASSEVKSHFCLRGLFLMNFLFTEDGCIRSDVVGTEVNKRSKIK